MSKDLVPSGDSFAITAGPEAGLVLKEAVDTLGIDGFSLSRISVPAGGGSMWTVPTLDGEENVKDLEVIVAHVRGNQKVWWRSEFTGEGSPPDCSSSDGITGYGIQSRGDDQTEPASMACKDCTWNQWGSARAPGGGNGPGKDCNDIAYLYLFRKDARLPDVIVVPPSSLKNIRSYSMKLIQAGKRMSDVVTKLTLGKAQSKSGITYSQIQCSFVRDLGEEEKAHMAEAAGAMVSLVTSTQSQELTQDNLAG